MNDYTLHKNDFKRYLLAELPDTRQEQLIFWKRSIPLPVDIIYILFEKRGTLLAKYLDQIGAAYLFAWANFREGNDYGLMIKSQPTANNKAIEGELLLQFEKYFQSSGIGQLLQEFSESLLLNDYEPNISSMFEAMCHEGKKYERIYLPASFKSGILKRFPTLLSFIGNRNGDMFANVVCDEMGIYRSGFGDVLIAYFNKLIEFILLHQNQLGRQYASASPFKLIFEKSPICISNELTIGSVTDGSLWQPLYKNARTTFILNSIHPYSDYLLKDKDLKEMLINLLTAMSIVEDNNLKPQERKVLEKFRQDVSRELRLILENK
jgi:hypothetical protein